MTTSMALMRITWTLTVATLAIVPCSLLVRLWLWALDRAARITIPEDEVTDAPFWLTGLLTGILERFFFTVAVALDVSGAGIGMVTWTLLKAQSHWQLFSRERSLSHQGMSMLYSSLLTSMFSMLLALLVGYYCRGTPWVWY